MGSLSFSLQVVLISSGVLSIALLFKISVPLVVDFSVYQAPLIWTSLASWLRPPYVYIILNCIIITIAASSRFHRGQHEQIPVAPKISAEQFHYDVKIPAAEVLHDYGGLESNTVASGEEVVYELADEKKAGVAVFEDKNALVVTGKEDKDENEDEDKDEDDLVISKSSWTPPPRMESTELLLLPAEKPLVSARFGHRKPVRSTTPEGGRALRVAKSKRHETLENTWKMITEGRAMPLTRHLKKSDTFENHGRQVNGCEMDASPPKKSETFKDRTNYQLPPPAGNSPASGKLRKEPSLSHDELNRRVEAFIKKFNEEMRMQRQQSLNQYKEMITRGSR